MPILYSIQQESVFKNLDQVMSVAVFERRGAVWFSFKAFTAVFEVFIYSNNKWHFSCHSLVIQINPLADFFFVKYLLLQRKRVHHL